MNRLWTLGGALCLCSAAFAQSYTLTDYGANLTGNSRADAISNTGVVVCLNEGMLFVAKGSQQSQPFMLGLLNIFRTNSHFTIAVSQDQGSWTTPLYAFDDFQTRFIAGFWLGEEGETRDVSDNHTFVGWNQISGMRKAFIGRTGILGFQQTPAGQPSEAVAVTNGSAPYSAGSIGIASSPGHMRACLWNQANLVMTFPPHGLDSRAVDMNETLEIVANDYPDFNISQEPTKAFLLNSSRGWDLGNLGQPYVMAKAMNNHAEIVGVSKTANGEIHNFLWRPKIGMVNLDEFLLPGSGFESMVVTGINDAGQLSATGTLPGGATRRSC